MPATFLIIPQWQGSASSRAMRLIDGVEAIAGDLPASATHRVSVPLGAGEALQTGVLRYSALAESHRSARADIDAHEGALRSGDPLIVIGGDRGSDLAAIASAAAAHPDLALVRFGAHASLAPPGRAGITTGGCFDDMAARAALGDGPEPLAASGGERVAAERLVSVGARASDDAERAFADEHGVRMLEAEDAGSAADAVTASGASAVYLHVELDVLDPAEITGVEAPEPFGVHPQQLADALKTVRGRVRLAGAAITGFAPTDRTAAERDLPTILRILGALTGPLR